jgi:hypothetical protein
MLVVSVLAAVWAVAMMTAPGRVGYYYFFAYAEYYMGVIALVSLSVTIMVGLVATDRLVLSIRQRVLLQSAHRTTGLIAVTALFVHVWTKYAEGHIAALDIVVPFLAAGNRLYIGMGTLSAWIMVMVMWTGIARSRFIGRGAPWMWRGIHAISYLMWPIALTHGLSAGRPAATWVVVSYIVCVLGVLVGLAVRLSVSLNRNKDFASSAGVGVKPVGSLVPTTSPAQKKPRKREREPEPEVLGPVAVVDPFQPARPAPAQSLPPLPDEAPAPRQRRGGLEEDDRPRRRRMDEEIEFEEPPPVRGRRYPGEDTSTRMRRVEMDDTSTRMRRVEADDTRTFRPDFDEPAPRQRRAYDDDQPPRPRRRAAAEPLPMYDDGRAGRDGFDDAVRPRAGFDDGPAGGRRGGGRWEADDAPRGRGDRGAGDEGRRGRSGFVDLADDEEVPTLVDMASRRSRRADVQEPAAPGRGGRRGGRGRGDDDVADEDYWAQLRGEAN